MLLTTWKMAGATALVLLLGTGAGVLAYQATGDAGAKKDARGAAAKGDAVPPATPPGDLEKKTEAVERLLDERVPIIARKTTLQDFLKDIKRATTKPGNSGIPIYVDPDGLQEVGVRVDTRIDVVPLAGVRLRENLRRVLRPLRLDFRVHDGLLKVSSRDATVDDEIKQLRAELKTLTERLKGWQRAEAFRP